MMGSTIHLSASARARVNKLLALVRGITEDFINYDSRAETVWADYVGSLTMQSSTDLAHTLNQASFTEVTREALKKRSSGPKTSALSESEAPPKIETAYASWSGGLAEADAAEAGGTKLTPEGEAGTMMSDDAALATYANVTYGTGLPPAMAGGAAPEPHSQFLQTLRRLERDSLGVAGFGQNYLLDEDLELAWSQALAAVLADTPGLDDEKERAITKTWADARRVRANDLTGGDAIYNAIQRLRDYYVMNTSSDYDLDEMRIWAYLTNLGLGRAATMGLYEFTKDATARNQALRTFAVLVPGGLPQNPQLAGQVSKAMKLHQVEGKYGPRSYGAAATLLTASS